MKKPRATSAKVPSATVAALDQVFLRCRRIETLAGLLEHCERVGPAYPLNPLLVGSAGFMIAEETRALRQWFEKLPRA